jgi:hypothetical protein
VARQAYEQRAPLGSHCCAVPCACRCTAQLYLPLRSRFPTPPPGAPATALPAGGTAGASHKDCEEAYELLRGKLGDAASAEQWRQQCAAAFAWSRYFGGADCVPLPSAAESAAVNGVAEKVAALAV